MRFIEAAMQVDVSLQKGHGNIVLSFGGPNSGCRWDLQGCVEREGWRFVAPGMPARIDGLVDQRRKWMDLGCLGFWSEVLAGASRCITENGN